MIKEQIQKFGKFVGSMIIPNIGVFIAWGFITAIFTSTGWFPNEKIALLVDPVTTYLLPILIGVTGGKVTGGARGGVVAAISTIGVIVGSDMPVILGSIVIGPLSGVLIKRFDKFINEKVPSGFEMLVNNLPYVAESMVFGMPKDDDLLLSVKIVYNKEYMNDKYPNITGNFYRTNKNIIFE